MLPPRATRTLPTALVLGLGLGLGQGLPERVGLHVHLADRGGHGAVGDGGQPVEVGLDGRGLALELHRIIDEAWLREHDRRLVRHERAVANDKRLILHRQPFGQVRIVPEQVVAVADVDDRRDERETIVRRQRADAGDVGHVALRRVAEVVEMDVLIENGMIIAYRTKLRLSYKS